MQKKSYLTCGGVFLVFIVIVVVVGIVGINAIQKSFRASILQELGFNSEQEFEDFVTIMNDPFDESVFYQNTYDQSDKDAVTQTLLTNIQLIDNSPLFYYNGYLNIEAIDKENNVSVLNAMPFTTKQFAYFETLLYASLFVDESTENNTLLTDTQILEYRIISPTTHEVVVKLNTQELKSALSDYGRPLPDNLYCTIKYDIIVDDNEYITTNQSIQFNALNEINNNKCIKYFNGILQDHPAKVFGDLMIALVNSFDNTTHTRTTFAEEIITIGGQNNE